MNTANFVKVSTLLSSSELLIVHAFRVLYHMLILPLPRPVQVSAVSLGEEYTGLLPFS